MRRSAGLALLGGLALAALLAWRSSSFADSRAEWDKNRFPAYDAYVYAAMSERPEIFTLSPWGSRLLTPTAVHVVPGKDLVDRFERVSFVGLWLCAALLVAWLRSLGFRPGASFAAAVAFVLALPVSDALREPFLAEPLALASLLALLLAIETGAPAGVVAVTAAIAALAKETAFFALPVAALVPLFRSGWRASLRTTLAAAGPMFAVTAVLRLAWAPRLPSSGPQFGPGELPGAVIATWDHFDLWWPHLLLSGLTPLALAGAATSAARPWLRSYATTLLLLLALPFAAAVYPGEAGFAGFFSADISRLLIYAVPLLLALALFALGRVAPLRPFVWSGREGAGTPDPHPSGSANDLATTRAGWHLSGSARRRFEPEPTRPTSPGRRRAGFGGWAVTAATLALLGFGLDRYRRADLSGVRDGPHVLGFVRESLKAAARLERGQEVTLDPQRQKFAWGETDPSLLSRLRWPLREGFGPQAHYGIDEIRLRGASAELAVPVFSPQDLRFALRLRSVGEAQVQVFLNGTWMGTARAASEGAESALRLPAGRLYRGDNSLRLVPLPGADRLVLEWASWSPAVE